MNITDDPDKKPVTYTIPSSGDAAATSNEITITVPPDSVTTTWPLIESSLAPGPRKHPKEKAKAKKKRKMAKASRRRNRR
jgi:hypothetical protein